MAETPRDPADEPLEPRVPRDPAEPPPERVERVERVEHVERVDEPPPRTERVEVRETAGPGPWLWLVPLLLVVAVLLWFVFSRGEPIDTRELEAPRIETPTVERQIEITVPQAETPPTQPATPPAEEPATPPPTEP